MKNEIDSKGVEYFGAALEYGLTRAWAASHLIVFECTIPGTSDLYSQRDVALVRLGLTQTSTEPSVKIVFAHAEKTGALHAWRGLFRDVVGVSGRSYDEDPLGGDVDSENFNVEQGIALAVERIERLETDGYLTTYLVPEHLVAAPVVFMDIYDDPLGFVLFASGDDESRLRCILYPDEYAKRWIEVIGKPLIEASIPGIVPCPFSTVKDRLIHEIRSLPTAAKQ
jgi:hypothetical protein